MAERVEGQVRLWDLPTRAVHWAIVALIAASWFTAETGRMNLHRYSGYTVLALLVFRIFWGFAGGSTARFAQFVKGPRTTLAYARTVLRREPSDAAGHNPMGAWSVLALLGTLAAQVTFGLFAVDVDGLESGPLSLYVDFDTGRAFAELHEASFNLLLALIALHLAAIAWYRFFKRENLVAAMLTGRRALPGGGEGLRAAPAWRAIAGIALAVAVAWFVSKGLKL